MVSRSRRVIEPVRIYYIYDPGVGNELGGFRVEKDGHERTVKLTSGQAVHFIRNGTLGETPLGKVSADGLRWLNQVSGGRVPLGPDYKPTTRRVESMGDSRANIRPTVRRVSGKQNAIQDPNTKATAVIGGIDPSTGKFEGAASAKEREEHQRKAQRSMYPLTHEGLSPFEVGGKK